MSSRPPSLAAGALDPDRKSSSTEQLGGLNLAPDTIAILEANLKKLEKTGKLQKWNIGSRVKSPRKTFSQLTSFTRFARPSSFRKKKTTPYASAFAEGNHSDDDMEHDPSFPLLGRNRSATAPNPPPKPPRTYTTTKDDLESEDKVLFPPGQDDLTADVFSTLENMGLVNKELGESDIRVSQSEFDLSAVTRPKKLSNGTLPQEVPKMQRSASAIHVPSDTGLDMVQKNISSPIHENQEKELPTISISADTSEASYVDTECSHRPKSADISNKFQVSREMSRSLGCLSEVQQTCQMLPMQDNLITSCDTHDNGELSHSTSPSPPLPPPPVSSPATADMRATVSEMDGITEEEQEEDDDEAVCPRVLDTIQGSLSSLDSYVSAEEGSNPQLSSRPSSLSSDIDSPSVSYPRGLSRPDSCASDLFQTPPDSTCSSPSDVEEEDRFDGHLQVLLNKDAAASAKSDGPTRENSTVTLSPDQSVAGIDAATLTRNKLQVTTTDEQAISAVPSPSSPEDDVFQVETETISFPCLPPSEVSSVKNDGEEDEDEIGDENEQEELDNDNEREDMDDENEHGEEVDESVSQAQDMDDENEHGEEVDESVSQAQSPLSGLAPVIIPDELSPNKVYAITVLQDVALFFLLF